MGVATRCAQVADLNGDLGRCASVVLPIQSNNGRTSRFFSRFE